MTALRDRLREMVSKWRIRAHRANAGGRIAERCSLDDCIRETEAALSAPDETTETEQALRGLVELATSIVDQYDNDGSVNGRFIGPLRAALPGALVALDREVKT